MKKKTGAAVLALLILLSVSLWGCGKSAAGRPKNADTGSRVPTSSSGNMRGNMYGSGLPIVKDRVTLKMVVRKSAFSGDFEDMSLLKELEQKTNVHIEWNAIPESQYEEKKYLLLASNYLPDAFFGQLALTTEDLVIYGVGGTFIPLQGLIRQYAPNIERLMNTNAMFKKLARAPDGNIYSIPHVRQTGYNDAPDQLFMYKPWLDKLGFAVPATVDEFYDVLKAFKNDDPNGNQKSDEIPFTFRYKTSYQGMYSLFGAFGLPDNVFNEELSHMAVINGRVVYTAIRPEYRQAIQYFSRFFQEGFIDREAFTQAEKQYAAKGLTSAVTVGSFISWNDFDVAGADRKKDYEIVPPLAGPDGRRVWNKYQYDNNGILSTGFTITKADKYPEITVRWVNEFYDPEFSIQVQYGPLGKNIKRTADGKYEFVPTPEGMTYNEFNFKDSPVDAPSAVFKEMFDSGKVPLSAEDKAKYKNVEKYYRPYMTAATYPGGAMFTAAELKTLKTITTNIYDYVNDMQAQWLMKGGIEREWDGYLAKLKEMRLDEMVSIYQTAYDRFNK